ncbi:hypothetical protein DU48_01200 [Methanosarcina mazei]|uniref:Uncharacterized protein n=1 Tax=Methanosarcina mazei TaxID=2209 RepID=A0A0F8MVD7_METMZ|nr:hypothetical protein DU44_02300 [Methanosarcina mazei]KKH16174.1 hypothetical protein DU48_01200 [Methanosarcina mazei]KKH17506.1 hypothetical protein DU65_02325 [Methanosarcina mazei]
MALRNGKNIISNIYFDDFIAIAEDNIKNKNHEIISSLLRKRRNLKYLRIYPKSHKWHTNGKIGHSFNITRFCI